MLAWPEWVEARDTAPLPLLARPGVLRPQGRKGYSRGGACDTVREGNARCPGKGNRTENRLGGLVPFQLFATNPRKPHGELKLCGFEGE